MFIPFRGDIGQSDMKTGVVSSFAQLPDQYGLKILAVNPDGNLLAVWGKERKDVLLVSKSQPYAPLGKILWDANSGTPLGSISLDFDFPSGDSTISYSPDKSIKASIDFANDFIILSEVLTGRVIRILDTEGAHLWGNILFSPDGKILASSGYSELILWDVESGQSIGKPLTSTGRDMAFTLDGQTLITTNWERYILWDINPQSWIEQTCNRVGRNLTILEWEKYFPGEEYRVTCPQWPPAN